MLTVPPFCPSSPASPPPLPLSPRAGAGVALSTTQGGANALVGVAIAASLLPPVTNTGICLAYAMAGAFRTGRSAGDFAYMGGISFCLFLINVVSIYLVCIFLFWVKVRGAWRLGSGEAGGLHARAQLSTVGPRCHGSSGAVGGRGSSSRVPNPDRFGCGLAWSGVGWGLRQQGARVCSMAVGQSRPGGWVAPSERA